MRVPIFRRKSGYFIVFTEGIIAHCLKHLANKSSSPRDQPTFFTLCAICTRIVMLVRLPQRLQLDAIVVVTPSCHEADSTSRGACLISSWSVSTNPLGFGGVAHGGDTCQRSHLAAAPFVLIGALTQPHEPFFLFSLSSHGEMFLRRRCGSYSKRLSRGPKWRLSGLSLVRTLAAFGNQAFSNVFQLYCHQCVARKRPAEGETVLDQTV